jgi:ribose transport system ATP-binding protein
MVASTAVHLERITKRFAGVQALTDVTLDVAAGSCHALCGENGAGKSTLGKILAGIHLPDSGRVFIHASEVRFGGPRDALAAGVGVVHQELAFCRNLSVAENLCLGALPTRRGLVARGEMHDRAAAMLAEIGTVLDVRRRVEELTIAQQQLVQIAAAVGDGVRIIVFDEPTSSLGQSEAERLYDLIGRLKDRGVACIYVSHRMAEIFRLCDTVTVLRDGRHVATQPAAALSEAALVQMMIGRPLAVAVPRSAAGVDAAGEGAELLRVEGLSSPGKFEDISFAVRAGEIVGMSGLVGAGRSEIAAALFGLDRAARGTIKLEGRAVRIRSARQAIGFGIGLVPEDRKVQGLVPLASAAHNISLAILARLSRYGWVRRSAEGDVALLYFDRLRVRAPGVDSVVASLSGGNQQKIVLARWLAAWSKVLILDEPTRGVDVGAKGEIHAIIRDVAASGTAVLLISSELPELLALSDRVLAVREGRLVGELSRAEADQDRLLRLTAGLAEGPGAGPGGDPWEGRKGAESGAG